MAAAMRAMSPAWSRRASFTRAESSSASRIRCSVSRSSMSNGSEVGRGRHVRRHRAGREAAAIAALALVAAGCREEVHSLRVVRRAPLPASGVETVATLRSGDLWLGLPGRFLIVDSMGTLRLERDLPGAPPRLLY